MNGNSIKAGIEKLNEKIIYFIYLIVLLLIYGYSLKNGYSLDDDYIINDKSVQKGIKAIPEIFGTRYINYYHSNFEYRPLAKSFFALEYQVFKLKPAAAHFVSLLLYWMLAVMAFKTFVRLKIFKGTVVPFAAVLIFLVHPIHTEVICSIKNQDILLSSLLGFLSIRFILNYAESKKLLQLFPAFLFLLGALLCKLDALAFIVLGPAMIFLKDKSNLKTATSLFFFMAVSFLVFILIRKYALHEESDRISRKMLFHENPLAELRGLKYKLPAIFSCFGFYIEKLSVAIPMVCYYGYDTLSIDHPFAQRYIYIGIFFTIFFVWAAIKYRKNQEVLTGLVFFIIPLGIYFNYPKIAPGIIADRFAFLSVFGMAFLCARFLLRLMDTRFSSGAISLLAGILIPYTGMSIYRSFDWQDRLGLIEKDIQKAPRAAMLHFLRGSYQLKEFSETKNRALQDSSILSFHRSLAIFEGNSSAWNNLGGIYFFNERNFEKAYPCFKRAWELDPHSDNVILYGKSSLLSKHTDEFCSLAVKEVNIKGNTDFIDFVKEFPYFLNETEQLQTGAMLIEKGMGNDTLITYILSNKKLIEKKPVEWARLVRKAYAFQYRNTVMAKEAALVLYENNESNSAAELMDYVEGKKK